MIFSLDNILGIHPQALTLRAERGQLLAQNLAHADTPHYKARDIDFQGELQKAARHSQEMRIHRSHQRHLVDDADTLSSRAQYRVPLHPSLDGNTVTSHVEQAAFTENALRYQASLMFINRRLSGIRAALSDQ